MLRAMPTTSWWRLCEMLCFTFQFVLAGRKYCKCFLAELKAATTTNTTNRNVNSHNKSQNSHTADKWRLTFHFIHFTASLRRTAPPANDFQINLVYNFLTDKLSIKWFRCIFYFSLILVYWVQAKYLNKKILRKNAKEKLPQTFASCLGCLEVPVRFPLLYLIRFLLNFLLLCHAFP